MHLAGDRATLGIAHFTASALGELRREWGWEVEVVVDDALLAEYGEDRRAFLDVITPRSEIAPRGRRPFWRRGLARLRPPPAPQAEYVPHPFFEALSRPPTPVLLCCFDLHIVDVPEKYGRHRDRLFQVYARSLARASAVVVPFPRPFRLLPSLVPGVADKLFLTACPTLLGDIPLREEVLRSVRERFGPPPGSRLLLYPGALHVHKNHVRLIEALSILIARGQRVTLVCPGSEHAPEATAAIREAIRSFGVEAHVVLPGFLSSEEVRGLYECCDLAVSPSHAEGGNAIVQEAIHFGRPVACSGIDAAREHVRFMGASVPFFDPDDAGDIARAIEGVLADPAACVAANRSARETVQSWTWERLARRYAEILDWLVAGADPRARPPAEVC